MLSSGSISQSHGNSALMASLAALKNARETPGKAALAIIDGVAEQVQQSADPASPVGHRLNAKA